MKGTFYLIASSAFMCLSLNTTKLTAQTVSMTEGSMDVVTGTGVVCFANPQPFTSENHFIRSFKISDYVACTSFRVDSVSFGIDQAASVNGSQLIDVNLYSLAASSPLNIANLTYLNAFNGSLPDVTSPDVATVALTTDFDGSGSVVVEIASPDGTDDHAFFMGFNDLAQTKPSYMFAPNCGSTDIDNIADLGFSSASLVINVYGHSLDIPKPDTFTAGKNMVCKGETVTFTVPSVTGMTYDWTYSGTGATVTGTNNTASVGFSATATSGTLAVTASNGGIISPPRTLDITVNPLPLPTISRAGNVLTSSIANNCTWYRNNVAITGANSSTYTMTENGNYFVKVTQDGCSGNSDTVQITDISNSTGVNDVYLQNIGLLTSPNPTTDILNIQCKIAVNASVFSADGRMLLSVKDAKKIDMRHLNAGLYYVLFTTENGTQLKREKIVKL